jgi:sigma-B regulation protein RsbU (phosphoserine phosphatase)
LFIVVLSVFYSVSKKKLETMTFQNAENLTKTTAYELEKILFPLTDIANNYIWIIEEIADDPDSYYLLTEKIVANNPNIIGSAIAFEENFYKEKGHFFAPYSYIEDNEIKTIQLGNDSYDYFVMDWFQIPVSIEKPYWSEPYYDEGGGNALITTYSLPIYFNTDTGRRIVGVLTMDISLDWFTEFVSSVKILETGYATIMSKNGTFITHPNKSLIMNQTIFTYAVQVNSPELRELGRLMQSNETGSTINILEGAKRAVYYTRLPSTDWMLAVMFPISEMYLPLKTTTTFLIILLIIGLTLLSFIVINIIAKQLAPLRMFAGSARQIAKGDFNVKLPKITSEDEMKELYDAFVYLQNNLNTYIETLKETTTEKEKFESELRIAREIQMGMLPKTFPPFPNRKEIDLFALLIPAKEVGGDLYDYFIFNDMMFFVIGDVSGKGIPASLLMAVTRSHFRSVGTYLKTPSQIMGSLNNSLAENNESNMFVTLFMGILDLSTGNLVFCNAGHNPPILLTENVEYINVIPNLPIGLIENYEFKEQSTNLPVGSTLLLYTDGLTEAENKEKELYGEEHLLEFVEKTEYNNTEQLIKNITDDLAKHVKDAEQSDDLTLLAIQYKGAMEYEKSLNMSNDINQISVLHDFIDEVGKDLNLEPSLTMSLDLALEEAVSNIIMYAYPKEDHQIIHLEVIKRGSDLIFTLTDSGIAFDPTLKDDPDLNLSVEDRPVGGLGIFLVKQIMTEVTYSRMDNNNVFVMKKKLK